MTVKKLTTICVVMLVGVASVWAKPALKRPVNIVQPDGTTVTLMLHGDEYRSFTTTVDGYTVQGHRAGDSLCVYTLGYQRREWRAIR